MAKAKKPIGAPPFNWTVEIDEEILTRLAEGESIKDICGKDRKKGLPSEWTFYKRLLDDEAFAKRYTRARETQAHREADEIREIADASTNEDYQVSRLRIDARKWRAAKMAPKVYGDKLDIETKGSLTVNISSDDADL